VPTSPIPEPVVTETVLPPGQQIRAAISTVLRWATRADVRQALTGSTGHALSPTDTWLLSAVADVGTVRATDLADWQGVDKSTMTLQLRRLEDRGLLVRTPDATDRRAMQLTATPEGRQVLEAIDTAGAAVFDGILADWPAQDREALAALLRRFADQLSTQPLKRGPHPAHSGGG
jgi:DNA-binding MarR family transcriptional regulator